MRPLFISYPCQFVLVCSLLANFLLFPLVVHAGTYDISYSSDPIIITSGNYKGSSGTGNVSAPLLIQKGSSNQNPALTDFCGSGYGLYPGSDYLPWSYTAKTQGVITATFTWNNYGHPNDSPPNGVVIYEYCDASWYLNNPYDWLHASANGTDYTFSGSCNNGLGGPVVNSTTSGRCVSDLYI